MTIMTMEDKLLLRHGQIDREHQEIFDIFDHLAFAIESGKDEPACFRIVNELLDFLVQHFLLEERLMNEHHYPSATLHKNEHESLISGIVNFTKKLENETVNSCIKQLFILRDRQSEHIRRADKALVAELRFQVYEVRASQAHA